MYLAICDVKRNSNFNTLSQLQFILHVYFWISVGLLLAQTGPSTVKSGLDRLYMEILELVEQFSDIEVSCIMNMKYS